MVPRERCVEVRGRLGRGRWSSSALDEADVERRAARAREPGVEAVAVCFLFSLRQPGARASGSGGCSREALPGVPITLSCRVAPEFREYLRARTTALNAALLPLAGGYVRAPGRARLRRRTASRAPLHLMQSNGGVAARPRPPPSCRSRLAASGPAAGVIGAARLGRAAGEHDLLTFDMGGTTADVALVVGGAPQLRFRGEQDGHPVSLPQIDVLSIGAGGGSIARGRRLRLAHASARRAPARIPARPPTASAATEATVTDAHVVLGTLGADRRARPAACALDAERPRARPCSARVGEPLGLSASRPPPRRSCAIADANMAQRAAAWSRSPAATTRARFALVALGGAGPMHACGIADELGVRAGARAALPRHHRRARAAALRRAPRPARAPGCGRPPTADRRRARTPSAAELEAEARDGSRARRTARPRSCLASSTCATAGRPTTSPCRCRAAGDRRDARRGRARLPRRRTRTPTTTRRPSRTRRS